MKKIYTIGPGGDFDAPRPTRIERAALIITGPTEVHTPLRLLSTVAWAAVRVREVPTSVPTALYNDNAFPLANLYLWGYPTVANDLELFTWEQVQGYATQADNVVLPFGYLDAVINNLAQRLCAQFGYTPNPQLVLMAKESKALIKAHHARSPNVPSIDAGNQGSRLAVADFNYLTGGP